MLLLKLYDLSSCANPSYTSEELVHQLRTANATVIIAHPNSLDTALDAARQCGIPTDHIIAIEKVTSPTQSGSASAIPYVTIQNLIDEGLSRPQAFTERRLNPGEGRTKLAFLSFSSGTTGKPKVCDCFLFVTLMVSLISMLGCRNTSLCRYGKLHSDVCPSEA